MNAPSLTAVSLAPEPAPGPESRRREAMLYVSVVMISVLVLLWQFYPCWLDLEVPFTYEGGDALSAGFYVKTIINYGWVWYNPSLGAPFGLDFRAYPLTEALHIAIICVMSLFVHDWPVVLNLFYLLGFVLTAITTLFLLREFSVSGPASVTAAILFAFLPSHFLRGEPHVFLASYYVVPLTSVVILWIACGYPFSGRRRWLAGIFSVLTGISGTYYAFFGAGFLLFAGLRGSLRKHNFQPMLAAIVCSSLLSAATVATLIPNILFLRQQGMEAVNAAVVRSPHDAEVYGLRIAQMLLPVTHHRVPLLARIKDTYNYKELGGSLAAGGNASENDEASLGLIASAGFIAIFASLLFRLGRDELWQSLILMTGSAVLLATIGGLGAVLIFIVPQVHAYNRISVYIAVWSLFAAALLWDRTVNRLKSPALRRAAPLLLIPILVAGILDQAPAVVWNTPWPTMKAEYENDQSFVEEIERRLPPAAMIYELPYVPFPEYPPVGKMLDYDLFRGYLHSSDLRWSYAAMKGSAAAAWERKAANQPVPQFVAYLVQNGFKGIYLDRFGFDESNRNYIAGGSSLVLFEGALNSILGPPAVVSANQRLVFYLLPAPADNGPPQAPLQ